VDVADGVAALVTDVPAAVVRSTARLPPRESLGVESGVDGGRAVVRRSLPLARTLEDRDVDFVAQFAGDRVVDVVLIRFSVVVPGPVDVPEEEHDVVDARCHAGLHLGCDT
jgi:hypothetical protein